MHLCFALSNLHFTCFNIFNYISTFSFQFIAYIPAEMYADSYF